MNGAHTAGADKEELYFGNQDNGTFASTNAERRHSRPGRTRDCCDSFDIAGTSNQVVYTVCCFGGGRANQIFISPAGMASRKQITAYPPGKVPGFSYLDVIDRFGPNSYALITATNSGNRVSITTNITAAQRVVDANRRREHAEQRLRHPRGRPGSIARRSTCWPARARAGRRIGCSDSTARPGGTWQQITPPTSGPGVGFGVFTVDRSGSQPALRLRGDAHRRADVQVREWWRQLDAGSGPRYA